MRTILDQFSVPVPDAASAKAIQWHETVRANVFEQEFRIWVRKPRQSQTSLILTLPGGTIRPGDETAEPGGGVNRVTSNVVPEPDPDIETLDVAGGKLRKRRVEDARPYTFRPGVFRLERKAGGKKLPVDIECRADVAASGKVDNRVVLAIRRSVQVRLAQQQRSVRTEVELMVRVEYEADQTARDRRSLFRGVYGAELRASRSRHVGHVQAVGRGSRLHAIGQGAEGMGGVEAEIGFTVSVSPDGTAIFPRLEWSGDCSGLPSRA